MSVFTPPELSRRLLLTSGMALFSSACTQLAFLGANIPASFGDYSRDRDLAYGKEPRNKLDVYLPATSGRPPVVVFFHGGGWNSGDKADYKFVGAALAEQGYIAVLPNYRLYPRVKFPVFMQDAAQAVAWVQEHLQDPLQNWCADAQRVYLMGHSAGAHIAVMLALNTSYLQQVGISATTLRGVVGLSGPYDFIPFTYDYMFDLFGPPARHAESQPINYVRADAPPMLLMHGLHDRTVGSHNTVNLTQRLKAVGAQVTTEYFSEADHADLVAAFSIPARRRLPVLQRVREFIGGPA